MAQVLPPLNPVWFLNWRRNGLGLQSHGPRADPFWAGGPKWGRKSLSPKVGFGPHLENGGKMARKNEKNGPENPFFEPF